MSRLTYYAASLPKMLSGIRNVSVMPALALAPGERTVEFSSGLKLRVRSAMELWIAKETCIDRVYETSGATIRDGWSVLDIGAGLGDFAVMTALERPSARVVAYEPFPASFALLRENIGLNGVSNLVAHNVAVGAEAGALFLATTGATVQHTTTGAKKQGEAVTSLRVPCVSLHDALEANEISRCDFLKMDCEGAEYDIFFSASDNAIGRLARVCLEYHDGFTAHSHADLVRFFEARGFATRLTPNPVHDYLGYLYAWRNEA